MFSARDIFVIILLAAKHIDLSINGTRYSVSRGIMPRRKAGVFPEAGASGNPCHPKEKCFYVRGTRRIFRVIKLREVAQAKSGKSERRRKGKILVVFRGS